MPTKKKRPKPHDDWPMYWHQSGYWCKTVKHRKWYFGNRGSADDGPEFDKIALDDYNANIVSIRAGAGRSSGDGLTVREMLVEFLYSRQELTTTGELSAHMFRDYENVARLVSKHFGDTIVADLTADSLGNFKTEISKGRSVVTVANYVRITRIFFKYAEVELNAKIPPFTKFKEPSRKVLRRDRNKQRRQHGAKMFEAEQIRALLEDDQTPVQMRAMILLGVNCGYGNKDCSELRRGQWKESGGHYWLDNPRTKTEVDRRCVLWPETVAALDAVADVRPKPEIPKHRDRVFLTCTGKPWVRDTDKVNDEVSKQFTKLLRVVTDPTTGKAMKRPGLSFYALRHTTMTIGDQSRDGVALRLIMGHADSSMAAVYRERIEDDRVVAVCEHVRNWLFTPQKTG